MPSKREKYPDLWLILENIIREGQVRQQDIELCFGWQSSDNSLSPASSLYGFLVTDTRNFNSEQLDAAILMARTVRHYTQGYVSPNDHALLASGEATVRNSRYFKHMRPVSFLSHCTKQQGEDLETAIALYLEAGNKFYIAKNYKLSRHVFGRAANLLLEQGNTIEAANALINACKGAPTGATDFLYLSIATRYFQLPLEERRRVRQAVLHDLGAAYGWLPAHDIYKVAERPPHIHSTFSMSESVSSEVWQKLQQLREEPMFLNETEALHEESQESKNNNDISPVEVPQADKSKGQAWSAKSMDRVAVLAMLADTDYEATEHKGINTPEERWRFEAAEYVQPWPEIEKLSMITSNALQPLASFLMSLQKQSCRPSLPGRPTAHLPAAVTEAMSGGRMAEAEQLARSALVSESASSEPLAWAGLLMVLSRCVACLRSSTEAISILRSALEEISVAVTPPQLIARSALLRHLALMLKSAGYPAEITPILIEALALAGCAADVIGVADAARRLAEQASYMGDVALSKHCNGLIRSLRYAWATEDHKLDFYYERGFGNITAITVERGLNSLAALLSPMPDSDLVMLSEEIALALEQHSAEFAPALIPSVAAVLERMRPVGAYTFAKRIINALQKLDLSPTISFMLQREQLANLATELGNLKIKTHRSRIATQIILEATPLLLQLNENYSEPDFKSVYEPLMHAKSIQNFITSIEPSCDLDETQPLEDLEASESLEADAPVPALLDQVRHFLGTQNACAIDFISKKGSSIAVCVSENETQTFIIDPAAGDRMKGKIPIWMRKNDPKPNEKGGLKYDLTKSPRPFDNLCRVATEGVRSRRVAFLKEFEHDWKIASAGMLTAALQKFISRYDLIYFCPHKTLYDLPMHLFYLSDGSLLCESKHTFYTRSVGDLIDRPTVTKTGEYIAINTNDAAVEKAVREFSPHLYQGQNHWQDSVSVIDRLTSIQQSGLTLLITHGMRHQDPRLMSFGFPRSGRLLVTNIRSPANDFRGCELVTIACHSGAGKSRAASANLGLCGAFLERNAEAVLGCLWRPITQEGIRFAGSYILERKAGRSRAKAYQEALLNVIHSTNTRAEGLIFAAPFYLFGRQNYQR